MKKVLLGLSLVCLLLSVLGGTASAQSRALADLIGTVAGNSSGLYAPIWPTPYAVSTPTCGAITPASGPNDRDTAVTIIGTGFATDLTGTIPPTVTLGATPLTAVTFVNDTTLSAMVLAGMTPGLYTVIVTNPDTGSANLPGAFTVTLPPTVTPWTRRAPTTTSTRR